MYLQILLIKPHIIVKIIFITHNLLHQLFVHLIQPIGIISRISNPLVKLACLITSVSSFRHRPPSLNYLIAPSIIPPLIFLILCRLISDLSHKSNLHLPLQSFFHFSFIQPTLSCNQFLFHLKKYLFSLSYLPPLNSFTSMTCPTTLTGQF